MNLADKVAVRFLDVSFGHGEEQSLTVWPDDVLTLHPSGDIELQSKTETQEHIVMRSEHIRWFRLADGFASPREPIDAERLERLGYPVTKPEPDPEVTA